MNSIQLLSKIKAKSDDLQLAMNHVLGVGANLNGIEKALLKKNCVELYELILKLKTEEEMREEKSVLPSNYHTHIQEDSLEKLTIQEKEPMTVKPPIFRPIIQETEPFSEVVQKLEETGLTLNEIHQRAEAEKEIVPEKKVYEAPVLHHDHQPYQEPKLEKPAEHMRIQYTVMPEPEKKPVVVEKELSFNERLALNHLDIVTKPLAEKSLEQPIDNIKSAINLNKKIAFVNELFKENVVEYAKSIDKLNHAENLNDALRIFNELKHLYKWGNDAELVIELERIIRRRHA